jgi:TRAP-type C4-dicarboxylate transport system substrate-binding protein
MRKIIFTAFFIFCLSAFFTINAFAKTTLTYSNFFPPTHVMSKLAESWIAEVEKRTDGEVTFQYFPGSTLAKGPQNYDAVVSGIADMGMTVLAYTRGRFPVATAIDLPLGYKSGVQATKIANMVLETFKPEEFNDTQIMYLHAHGPGFLHTTQKKVSTLEDIKGLKIRTTGASGKIIDALGGSPVGKSMGECYQLLQKDVVDGSLHPVESNYGWKLGEVIKYITQNYSTAYTTAFAVYMNKSKWNSLSHQNQLIIKQINKEWPIKHGHAWDDADKQGIKFVKEKGGEFIQLTNKESAKWAELMAPVIDAYIQDVSAKGIDGKAVVDFIKSNL